MGTPSLDSVKNSLRIDHEADDEMLTMIILTAADYIKRAITDDEEDKAVELYESYEWAVSLLAQHWYLNREEATARHTPMAVTSLIQQMRGEYYADH